VITDPQIGPCRAANCHHSDLPRRSAPLRILSYPNHFSLCRTTSGRRENKDSRLPLGCRNWFTTQADTAVMRWLFSRILTRVRYRTSVLQLNSGD